MSRRETGGQRQERIRAHGPTGRVAGAATEVMSGSQPISSTACPTYVLPQSPRPGARDPNHAPGPHRQGPRRAVSSPEVVAGGDEPPFGPARRSASGLGAPDLVVELQLAEHRLDGDLAGAIGLAAVRGGKHAAHEVTEAAGPAETGPCAAR